MADAVCLFRCSTGETRVLIMRGVSYTRNELGDEDEDENRDGRGD